MSVIWPLERVGDARPARHTCSISRMLAYLGVSGPPSSSMVPGKPPCRSSDALHPIKPAVTATANTLDSDQTEAARGSWWLPAAARRRRDVVKRCRPAMRGPRRAAVATTDRPSGIALIARRFADMQGDPESRNKRSLQRPDEIGCTAPRWGLVRSFLENWTLTSLPSTRIRSFLSLTGGSTHLFFSPAEPREFPAMVPWSPILQHCRTRSSKPGPDLPARYGPMIATLHLVPPVSGALGDVISNSR